MIIKCEIIGETENSTASILSINNKKIGFILQDGYRKEKIAGETRIPSGEYLIVPVVATKEMFDKYDALMANPVLCANESKAQRWIRNRNYEFIPMLDYVPRFTHIYIHSGNSVYDTSGCLLPNMGISKTSIDGDYVGNSSRILVDYLTARIKTAFERKEKVVIEVCH